MCVVCYVDEEMKDKIIAYGAEFHKVSKSPYGKDDEIGMLHLIDAKSRSAIMSRADASKVFDLSVDNFVGMPGWFGAGDAGCALDGRLGKPGRRLQPDP